MCLKLAGREGGSYCVVLETKSPFVLITGPKSITGIKRRRCNIAHLEPTEHKLELAAGAADSAVEAAWKTSGLVEKLNISIPTKRTLHKPGTKS